MSDAKADCEVLLAAVLPFAETMLTRHREFYPYAGAMKADGEVVSIGALTEDEAPPTDSMIETLKQSLRAGAGSGQYRATALVYDVRAVDDDGAATEAVAIALNHRDDYSVIVLMPYGFEGMELVTGEFTAQAGEADIFTA